MFGKTLIFLFFTGLVLCDAKSNEASYAAKNPKSFLSFAKSLLRGSSERSKFDFVETQVDAADDDFIPFVARQEASPTVTASASATIGTIPTTPEVSVEPSFEVTPSVTPSKTSATRTPSRTPTPTPTISTTPTPSVSLGASLPPSTSPCVCDSLEITKPNGAGGRVLQWPVFSRRASGRRLYRFKVRLVDGVNVRVIAEGIERNDVAFKMLKFGALEDTRRNVVAQRKGGLPQTVDPNDQGLRSVSGGSKLFPITGEYCAGDAPVRWVATVWAKYVSGKNVGDLATERGNFLHSQAFRVACVSS